MQTKCIQKIFRFNVHYKKDDGEEGAGVFTVVSPNVELADALMRSRMHQAGAAQLVCQTAECLSIDAIIEVRG